MECLTFMPVGVQRVYVGNLPYRVRERDIEDIFAKFGRIREVDLKTPHRGAPYAFLDFDGELRLFFWGLVVPVVSRSVFFQMPAMPKTPSTVATVTTWTALASAWRCHVAAVAVAIVTVAVAAAPHVAPSSGLLSPACPVLPRGRT